MSTNEIKSSQDELTQVKAASRPVRVGILTFYYHIPNYGALLQAYALQRVVEDLGYEAEQICYRKLPFPIPERYAANKEQMNEFGYKIPHSDRPYCTDTIHQVADKYDIFIAGSDQIWNRMLAEDMDDLSIRMLAFVPSGKKRIAYAASCGGNSPDEGTRQLMKQFLPSYSAISVREASLAPVVSELSGMKAEAVLDPALLIEPHKWKDIEAPLPDDIPKEYTFVYSLGFKLSDFPEDQKALESLGYPIIECCGGDVGIDSGIFISLIKNAKFVYADSFHATVFSLIYHKPFYSKTRNNLFDESMNTRLVDLLEICNMPYRFVDGIGGITPEVLLAPYDGKAIDEVIAAKRQASLDFLKRALEMPAPQYSVEEEARLSKAWFNIKARELEKLRHRTYTEFILALALGKGSEVIAEAIKKCSVEGGKQGNTYLYGKGEVGMRIAFTCENCFEGFLDASPKTRMFHDYPVYASDQWNQRLKEGDTVIVTIMYDFNAIESSLLKVQPKLNIVSINQILEEIVRDDQ